VGPVVLIVGRLAGEAKGVRGEPFAAGQRYFRAVARAGGVTLMLPPITSLVDEVPGLLRRVDAVVLHGGGDVDPRQYGQEPTAEELYGVVPEHDEVEFAVTRAAIEADLPLFAICRGMQVLNVALGGTLHQHIGSEAHWFAFHEVPLEPDSQLAAALGAPVATKCHCVHHQAVDRLAPELRAVGSTADGLIHACELPSARWTVATQWHPEDSADTDPEQQSLFDSLIAHC